MTDETVAFKKFCELCDKIKSSTDLSNKELLLHKFIVEYKQISNSDDTFYPVLRLLVPQYERERGPYGLKETNFAKLLNRSLPLSNTDANYLQQYKFNLAGTESKDFADVTYWVLRKYCAVSSTVSIAQVNQYLDRLATKHADHKPREVEDEVFKMAMMTTALEQKWMIRIILKDMKLGMGNDRILRVFHPDAADLYDVCNDLSEVCKRLKNPVARLHELDVNLFIPFRPMLCLKCDLDVLDKITKEEKPYYVETKFDGERFQMHMKDGIFEYFSKNGYKYTNIYGATFDKGLISSYLKENFKNVQSIILDGEMMGWNTRKNNFGSKGMSYDVKKLNSDSIHRPCYCVFDILLYNGVILTNKPLWERLKILDQLIIPIEGVIMKSSYTEIQTKQDLLKELNKSVDKKEEGICFKDPNSIYKPNNRNSGWWKMKLEFFDGLMTELDLLIIGAYYGEGRSLGKISSFLLGVAVSSNQEGASPAEFHSFAKVASGFTANEYKIIMQKLSPYFKPVIKDSSDHGGIIWTKEKPDVWIEPRKSCVLQIRASELITSTEFKTKYTLRFPRVEKIRDDKPWYNCLTLAELENLTKSGKAVEKLSNRHITAQDVDVVPKKRKRQSINKLPQIDLKNIETKSNLLKRKEFHVLTGNNDYTKQEIEVKIYENGGLVVQLQGPKTYCILMGNSSPDLHLLKLCNTHDVVKLDWFLRALDHSTVTLLKKIPSDYVVMSENTKNNLSANYDRYGDSYTKISDESYLIAILQNTESDREYINLMPKEMVQFDKILSYNNPLGLFRMCAVYFDKYAIINDNQSEEVTSLKQIENTYRFYGGLTCSTISGSTTHVVIYSRALQRLTEIMAAIRLLESIKINVVSEDWITDSVQLKRVVSEEAYELKL